MVDDTTTGLELNQKIVLWTKGKLGKQVGRGECWDLAEEALKQAGAQTSNDLGPVGKDTDYIWGEKILHSNISRGDIFQIRDHKITKLTVTKYKYKDGTFETEEKQRTYNRGHHTAIVRSKPTVDGMVKIYEQHVNGRDVVQKGFLYLRSISPKTERSFAKRKHPGTNASEQVEVTTTTTVKVSGTVWAYRPKAKQ